MKKNTAIGIAAVAVAGALTVGLGAVSSWYTNWDVKTWFGRGGGNATTQPENPEELGGNGDLSLSEVESNGINLMSAKLPRAAYAANGISERAVTAYVLTATVYPESVSNKTVDWSIEGEESDALTVTPTEDGSLTATVECNRAFTGMLYVVCTSRSGSASARCSVTFEGIPSAINISTSLTENGGYTVIPSTGSFTVNFALDNAWHSVGSKYGNYEITVTKHGKLVKDIFIYDYSTGGSAYNNQEQTVNFADWNIQDEFMTFSVSGSTLTVNCVSHYGLGYETMESKGIYYAFHGSYKSTVEKLYYTVTVRERSSGLTTSVNFDWGTDFVTHINMSDTSLVF